MSADRDVAYLSNGIEVTLAKIPTWADFLRAHRESDAAREPELLLVYLAHRMVLFGGKQWPVTKIASLPIADGHVVTGVLQRYF